MSHFRKTSVSVSTSEDSRVERVRLTKEQIEKMARYNARLPPLSSRYTPLPLFVV